MKELLENESQRNAGDGDNEASTRDKSFSELSRLGRRIAPTAFVSFCLRAVGMLLALITTAIITRNLGPVGFGEYSTIFAILFIFSLLADFGLRQLLVKELAQSPHDEKRIVSRILSIRFAIIIAALALAFIFAATIPGYSERVKWGVLLSFFVFIPLSLTQAAGGFFQHRFQFERVSIAEGVGRIIQLTGVLYVAKTGGGLYAYCIAAIAGAIATLAVVYIGIRDYLELPRTLSFSWAKKIFKDSWPLAVSTISILIYFKLDTILLSLLRSESDVAMYNIAYKIFESTLFFPALIAGLGMPILAANAHKRQIFRTASQKITEVIMILAIPAAVGIIVLADPIILLIAGSSFIEAAQALQVLALTLLVVFPAHLFSHAIIAAGKQRQSMKVYMFGAVLNIVLNIIIIPEYGFVGAAWTTLATEFFVTLWLMNILKKSRHYSMDILYFIKPIVASLIMAMVIIILQQRISGFKFLICIPVGFIVYTAAIILLRGISFQDFLALFRGIKSYAPDDSGHFT